MEEKQPMTHQNYEATYALILKPGTKVMGILNSTPDSFSGDGIFKNPETAVAAALTVVERFIEEGADIIDVGAESTRPGATAVDIESELQRIIPIIQAIRQRYHIPLSVDTTKSVVASQAVAAGASMINDVSGLMMDPNMSDIVVASGVPIVIMHSQLSCGVNQSDNHPNMQENDIVSCVVRNLEHLALHAISRGIKPSQIIIDPGIGFGKTPLQNLQLIKGLDQLKALGYPLLLGASRKSFIGHLTGVSLPQRLPASLAAATLAVMAKTDFIRVHDVAPTKQVIQLLEAC